MTERGYFKHLNRALRGSLVDVEQYHGRDPVRLVARAVAKQAEADESARRERDDNQRYDQVWCVFDVDQHERLVEAQQLASENGILTAISNPCFELWALLHFHDQRAHINGKDIQSTLRRSMPGYKKQLNCAALDPHRHVATARAKLLDTQHERNGAPHGNPSTGVWRLTSTIEAKARRFRVQGSRS